VTEEVPHHLRPLSRVEALALPPELKAARKRYLKLAKKRRYRQAHPNRKRGSHLKSLYGIPLEVYNYAIIKQLNLCAICGEPETSKHQNGNTKRLAVDHDHDTGIVRGFLCQTCNTALGQFRDNPTLLIRAATYLLDHNEHTRLSPAIARLLQIPIT
jgi:hypothetical protein